MGRQPFMNENLGRSFWEHPRQAGDCSVQRRPQTRLHRGQASVKVDRQRAAYGCRRQSADKGTQLKVMQILNRLKFCLTYEVSNHLR